MKRVLLTALTWLFSAALALAQTSPGLTPGQVPSYQQWNTYFGNKQNFPAVFVPLGYYGNLTLTANTSAYLQIPGVTLSPTVPITTVAITNLGNAIAYTTLCVGNSCTANLNADPIQPGANRCYGIGNATYVVGYSTSSETLRISSGFGDCNDTTQGPTGGGTSVSQGTVPWVVDTTTGGGSNLWTAVTSAIPAGTNTIGGVLQSTSPWIIDSSNSGNLYGALTGPIPAGSNLIGAVMGAAASGVTVNGNPLLGGGRAQNAEQTAVTNGSAIAASFDIVGKQITSPYANKENFLSGAANATNTAATTIIAAQAAGIKIYVTSLQCARTDAAVTPSHVTLNDAASTPLYMTPTIASAGFEDKWTFPVPLVVAAATALTFTSSASLTTVFCSAQGYGGT